MSCRKVLGIALIGVTALVVGTIVAVNLDLMRCDCDDCDCDCDD